MNAIKFFLILPFTSNYTNVMRFFKLICFRDVDNQKALKKAKKIKQLDEDNKKLRQLLK